MFKNRKKISLALVIMLAFSLILFTAACGSETPAPAPAPAAPQISAEEILTKAAIEYFDYLPQNRNLAWVDPARFDLVENIDKYYLIDIRSAEKYADGHIPTSINIPMDQLGKAIPTLPKDQTIILICDTGRTANQSSGVLRMAGFDSMAIRGGHEEWVNAGLELEK